MAKHLNFRAAADELALTQSAVSKQIQALEDEVGVPLFLRHACGGADQRRGTTAPRRGAKPLSAWTPPCGWCARRPGGASVAITTWASFASMWLIPGWRNSSATTPASTFRIDASDAL